MAPRALSNATISFGLVSIPTRLYSAANPSSAVSFRLLSPEGNRLKQLYVDPKQDDKPVPRSEMVKGYEFAKDRYVIFTDDELKELQEQSTQSIDIEEFVPEDQVPKVYLQKAYYLGPDKGGDRAYRLLARALEDTKRCALARYAARGKMYLVLIAPRDAGLVMYQLHYPEELVDYADIPKGEAEPKDDELSLAKLMIEQKSNDTFQPDKYEDEVRKRILAAIEQKVSGQEITLAPEQAPQGQIIDLMEALKASLADGDGGSESAPAKSGSRKKKSSSKRAKSS